MKKLRWPWNATVICESEVSKFSKGVFLGDNPLDFPTTVFMVQMFICIISTATMDFLLKPLGHCSYFSHMLGALLAGPNVFGLIDVVHTYIFTDTSMYMFETIQYFGLIFYVFFLGLKVDLKIVVNSGRNVLIIGFLHFLTPVILSLSTAYIMKMTHITGDQKLGEMLPIVAGIESGCAFYVIVCVLSDLKLLNSELGRLAMSSSLISGTLSAIVGLLLYIQASNANGFTALFSSLSLVLLSLMIVYVMRPLMLWMVRQTPDGYSIKDEHMAIIFLLVLISGFFGQLFGQHLLFGPVVLGLSIPPGPPLASSIEDKLHSFYTGILLPLHCCSNAWRATVSSIQLNSVLYVAPIVLLAFLGKLSAAMLPSLYLRMPFQDALSLGLIMCSQGIFDVQYLRLAESLGMISLGVYTIMLYITVLSAGIIAPLVSIMYKPSRRFFFYKRRTIEQTGGDRDLRILACVYQEDNAPGIITLIEASNPTSESRIVAQVLHLIELQGQAMPLLMAHKHDRPDSFLYNYSIHIIKAFKCYEQSYSGAISVQCFTAMAPLETMHEDICTLALNKRTALIIIPFHRQQNSDGLVESATPIRNVNRNVLEMAPCSVGILVNQGSSCGQFFTPGSRTLYSVVIVFLGGSDDREALTYCMRMGDHSNVTLTLIQLVGKGKNITSLEGKLDSDKLNEFKSKYKGNDRITYRENVINDGVGTVKVLRSLEKNNCDLIVVGRHHSRKSPLMKGLTMWNEFPELGCIGEMVLATDVSVLVVQQQPHFSEDVLPEGSPRRHSNAV